MGTGPFGQSTMPLGAAGWLDAMPLSQWGTLEVSGSESLRRLICSRQNPTLRQGDTLSFQTFWLAECRAQAVVLLPGAARLR